MYEYRVEIYLIKKAAEEMNKLAEEGWRVVATMPNEAAGYGMVVTYERKKSEG